MHSGKLATLKTGVTTINRVAGIRVNLDDASLAGLNLKGTIDMAKPTIGFLSLQTLSHIQAIRPFILLTHNKTVITVFYYHGL